MFRQQADIKLFVSAHFAAFIDTFLTYSCPVVTWNNAPLNPINGGLDNITQGSIASAMSGLDFRIKDRESVLYCVKMQLTSNFHQRYSEILPVPEMLTILSTVVCPKLALFHLLKSTFLSNSWPVQFRALHLCLVNRAGSVSEILPCHSFLRKNVNGFIWETWLALLLRSQFLQPRSWLHGC